MLIRASGAITEDFFLLTLGASARYILRNSPNSWTLFNPGCSAQLPSLLDRLAQLSITPPQLSCIIVTHLAADTVPAAVHLKALNPAMRVIGVKSFQDQLESTWKQLLLDDRALAALMPTLLAPSLPSSPPKLFDYYLSDAESLTLAPDQTLRCHYASGFTQQAAYFFLEPLRFLIVERSAGYFRGKELPAPAADFSMEGFALGLNDMLKLECSALCLPFKGVLSGAQVTRHLTTCHGVLADIQREVVRAKREGIPINEIYAQVMQGIFTDETPDPLLRLALKHSGGNLWKQLLDRIEAGSATTDDIRKS